MRNMRLKILRNSVETNSRYISIVFLYIMFYIFVPSTVRSFVQSFVHSFLHMLIRSDRLYRFTLHSVVYIGHCPFICLFGSTIIHSFVRPSERPFVHSLVRSFVRSFVYMHVCSISLIVHLCMIQLIDCLIVCL